MMSYYKDLREYLRTLEKHGKLVRIKSPINKDTELHPLVRLQYVGLPEEQRKAFLFENIVDSRGKAYQGSVAVSALAASSEIYAIGMMCQPEEISEKLTKAQSDPIEPKIVREGPAQEEVHLGDSLLEHGGLDEFPIPISTPGYDAAPVFTAPAWISKDPESGIRNTGTYRAMIKSPTRTGIDFSDPGKGCAIHWRKCKERGVPLQAAIVVGGPPCIGYASVSRYPTDVDEMAVAGGIAGEPLELVKCKTLDLEVPAHAEVVIEGELNTDELELEGAFGESGGFMSLTQPRPYFTVKCITHRRNPIWLAFISQYQPSESSKVKQYGNESVIFNYLREHLGMEHVLDVAFYETSDSSRFLVLKLKKVEQDEVWRTLEAAVSQRAGPRRNKIIIAVDEDINHRDSDAVIWALSHRFQPHRDCRIVTHPSPTLVDLSLAPSEELERLRAETNPEMPESSIMLINATLKWPYPPVSLPTKEFMEKALQLWEKEGLPPLKLTEPWWGHNLGYWSDEDKEKAERAVRGEYYQTGDNVATRRMPT
ncbi:UbiD family decarboxylase [Chloroflexota bacterium]